MNKKNLIFARAERASREDDWKIVMVSRGQRGGVQVKETTFSHNTDIDDVLREFGLQVVFGRSGKGQRKYAENNSDFR